MNDLKQDSREMRRARRWRKRLMVRGIALMGVIAGVATGTWAVEESGKAEQTGLRGLFSNSAPDELSADEFAKLNGNWAEWSKGAAAAVRDFYAKLETEDAAGQRKSLKVLKAKLDVMQRAIDDPRYISLIEPLLLLHGRLAERIAIAEAVLDTLDPDLNTVQTSRLRLLANEINNSVAALRADLSKIPNGLLWVRYVKADTVEGAVAKSLTDDATRSAIQAARERITGRDALSDPKQKEFLGRPSFLALDASLARYLEGLDWTPATDQTEARAQLKTLLDAIDGYSVSHSDEDAAKIRNAYAHFGKVAPDGGDRISGLIQKFAMNYNVRVVASEEFLNRLMAEARTDNGPVVDNVMGAAVSGNQTTATRVGIELLPSPSTARFDLTLHGTIQSSTAGVTDQATVYTQGNHTFVAKKEVIFDGASFMTRPATISVNPHNTTTGIATNVGFPFRGIANHIASQEVEARRGAGEAHAAMRVRENVLPKFDSEVDRNFAEAGPKLQNELFAGLRATGLFPDTYIYTTTDSVLRVNTRIMGPNELAANMPRVSINPKHGATLMMHESAINNAINRMDLAGQTLTEPQLRAKLEDFFSKAVSHKVTLSAPKKESSLDAGDDSGPNAIIFDTHDPIRISFENGELILVIRAGFKQEGKDDIPTREITVPIKFEVKNQKLLVTRGAISVAAADDSGGGIAINGVVRKKIQSALPDREIDTRVEFKGPRRTVVTHINSIKLVDGWVVVSDI